MDRDGSIPYVPVSSRYAGVAELVDARDSKSRFLGSVGSSPTTRTILNNFQSIVVIPDLIRDPIDVRRDDQNKKAPPHLSSPPFN